MYNMGIPWAYGPISRPLYGNKISRFWGNLCASTSVFCKMISSIIAHGDVVPVEVTS
jgi:hypothetical protein